MTQEEKIDEANKDRNIQYWFSKLKKARNFLEVIDAMNNLHFALNNLPLFTISDSIKFLESKKIRIEFPDDTQTS